jgi:hypothetical protein
MKETPKTLETPKRAPMGAMALAPTGRACAEKEKFARHKKARKGEKLFRICRGFIEVL